MTTIHTSPPPGAPPFAIYEDPEDQEPPSPSEAYDGDVAFQDDMSLSAADVAIPSIEHEHEHEEEHEVDAEPQPYRSSFTALPSLQSRRVSAVTTTSFISSLPSEISISSRPIPPTNHDLEARYTPRKDRPPFRNPSSVRAMQMSSPPPLSPFESHRERTKGAYKLATPSRSGRSETPVSATGSRRSTSHRTSQYRESQVPQSPRPTPTPQQHLPLVLLHITILPMQMPYSHDLMVKVMPPWLVNNYKLLEEKLQDIILMRRGLLIPHPSEEYDLLEERILENLELKTPRLLKCGHFVGSEPDTDEHDEDDDELRSVADSSTGRGSRMSGGTLAVDEEAEWKYPTPETDDGSVCTDCHRQVKLPGTGVGSGTKRWDIKIYAANGLMRAGAWTAAWSEMERCDVEIAPWIPHDVRKALEKRVQEEQEAETRKQIYAAEVQRRVEEEAARLKKLEVEAEAEEQRRIDEAEVQKRLEVEMAARQRKIDEEVAAKKLEDTLQEKIEEAKEAIRLEFEAQALAEAKAVTERLKTMEDALEREQEQTVPTTPRIQDPPFSHRQPPRESRGGVRSHSRQPQMADIPLGTLFKNYVLLLARDQKNLAIIALGLVVVFLCTHMNPKLASQIVSPSLPTMLPENHYPESVSSVVVTTTATSTATSFATVTVTHSEHAKASHETLESPSTSDQVLRPTGVAHHLYSSIPASAPSVTELLAEKIAGHADSAALSFSSVTSVLAEKISGTADPAALSSSSAAEPLLSRASHIMVDAAESASSVTSVLSEKIAGTADPAALSTSSTAEPLLSRASHIIADAVESAAVTLGAKSPTLEPIAQPTPEFTRRENAEAFLFARCSEL